MLSNTPVTRDGALVPCFLLRLLLWIASDVFQGRRQSLLIRARFFQ